MAERRKFEMTEEDLAALLDASKPVPAMLIGSVPPPTPRENAHRAWERLGKKMGFAYMTVKPVSGKSQRFFTAEAARAEGW